MIFALGSGTLLLKILILLLLSEIPHCIWLLTKGMEALFFSGLSKSYDEFSTIFSSPVPLNMNLHGH